MEVPGKKYILREVQAPSKVPFYIALGVVVVFCLVGIILVAVGGTRLSQTKNCKVMREGSKDKIISEAKRCEYSNEAKRVGLDEFLAKVKSTYYEMHPNNAVYDPDSTPASIRQDFSPYNSHPGAIRDRTVAALRLYKRALQIDRSVNSNQLKPHEIKAIAQVKHFLQSNFGTPYDENYFAGDWMLGPNKFCWQPICEVGRDLQVHFTYKKWGIRPKTLDDVDFVIDHLKKLNDSLMQYIENVKYGVGAGFVRSVEDCQDGLYSIQRVFFEVSQHGPGGVLNESYTKEMRDAKWLADLDLSVSQAWEKKHGKSVRASIDEALVEYVGRPLDSLLKYLEFNHSQYCVPSNISSGLATLPLQFIYRNGTSTGKRTNPKLPFGEDLNGTKAYEMILPYFTTNQMSPDEVYALGERMLNKLYPRAVVIAKKITGKQNDSEAVEDFKKRLEDQSMFFNEEKIPENESNKEAFSKCTSMETAKKYCPMRHKAMLTWFDTVNAILGSLAPKTNHMFYHTGEKQSTPNCPVLLVAKFNPGSGSQSYSSSGKSCSRPSHYKLPFFLKDLGPRYNAISVAAHEARPGHHTQVQGFRELFGDNCGGVISWLNGASYYTAFTEGWALYAENPLIAEETDAYDNNPLQLYGMLKWQIWRALRLMMDTGLHYKGMKRWEALKLFADYAWDKTDKAVKDVTRYQSVPGQATAYMIGQLRIWQVRNETQATIEKAGGKFSEKDFHYQVLSQGSSPLSYLDRHLKKYAACVVNLNEDGCEYIMGPLRSSRDEDSMDSVAKEQKPDKPYQPRPYDEHYE
ncbi:uncharacterized protein [Montipora capricornis]|uniref:uncharacterized protein n=1 Tax=Montipora capricornis TaxID=246305 RepID=UPI0035F1E4BB